MNKRQRKKAMKKIDKMIKIFIPCLARAIKEYLDFAQAAAKQERDFNKAIKKAVDA